MSEQIEPLLIGFHVFSMFQGGAASAVGSEECWWLGDESQTWILVGFELDVSLMGSELPMSSKRAMQVISYIAHHVIFIKYA